MPTAGRLGRFLRKSEDQNYLVREYFKAVFIRETKKQSIVELQSTLNFGGGSACGPGRNLETLDILCGFGLLGK